MADLLSLPRASKSGGVNVVVEAPRGSEAKLKYEPELGAFTLVRPLPMGLRYPFDWGFVPSTLASDGDPLDALVLHDVATYPGVVLACRAVAIVEVTQKRKSGDGRERNDRVIAVPEKAARPSASDLDDIQAHTRRELEVFFRNAVAFADKDIEIVGWRDARAACAAIERANADWLAR